VFAGADIERIPETVIAQHSKTAKRLDVSYNKLWYIDIVYL